MLIIPAIDIYQGKCVRLYRGNFSKITVYSSNPVEVAKRWEFEGAKLLHVVDLEGARKVEFVNFSTIQKITSAVNIPVQAGGGIRSLEEAVKLFSYGVTRLIVSTMVLENQPLLSNLIERLTGRIDVSLDARKEL